MPPRGRPPTRGPAGLQTTGRKVSHASLLRHKSTRPHTFVRGDRWTTEKLSSGGPVAEDSRAGLGRPPTHCSTNQAKRDSCASNLTVPVRQFESKLLLGPPSITITIMFMRVASTTLWESPVGSRWPGHQHPSGCESHWPEFSPRFQFRWFGFSLNNLRSVLVACVHCPAQARQLTFGVSMTDAGVSGRFSALRLPPPSSENSVRHRRWPRFLSPQPEQCAAGRERRLTGPPRRTAGRIGSAGTGGRDCLVCTTAGQNGHSVE